MTHNPNLRRALTLFCFLGQINSRLPADPGPVSSLGVVGVGDVAGATGTSSTSTLEPGGKVGGPTSLSGAVGVGDVAVSTGNGSTSTPAPGGQVEGLASSLGTTGVGGVTSAAGASPSSDVGKPVTKLNIWHGEHRVIVCASKKNGAYGPFCAALRDAFTIPDPEAMDRVRRVWKQRYPSWSNQEIEADMRAKLSSHLLKHVPRIVPRPEILLPRYDNVIETFKVVRDGATGNT